MKKAVYVFLLAFLLAGCKDTWHPEGLADPALNSLFNNPGGDEGSGTSDETVVPGVPSGVQATAVSTSEIMVLWTAVAGANSYIVFYGTETAGSSQYGGTVSGLSFTITGLQPGITYYTTVMAGNGAGWSAKSPAVSGTTNALTAPTGLSVTAQSQAGMSVSWNAVSGASSYKIYRAASSSGPFTVIMTSTTASYIDTGLTANTSYWYKVSVLSSGGTEGPQSSAVSGTTSVAGGTAPGTPGGVGTTVLSSTDIRVSWTTVSGAGSYLVYYGTEAAGSSQYGGTASSSPFTVTGLQPGTAYYFTMKAGNATGWSAGSTPVSGITTALAAPTGLSVTAQSSSGIAVNWSAVSEAALYKIYRAGSSSGPFTNIAASSAASYTDTGLTAGTTYWYKVSAVNGTEGTQSAAVSGMTLNTDADLFVGSGTITQNGVTNLFNALAWIKTNAVNNTSYTIRLNEDVSFAPYVLDSSAVNNKSGITIILKGNGAERKITLNANGSLFTVNTGVTLTLDDKVTLVGRSANTDSLVKVYPGGKLVMNDGAKISGNRRNYTHDSSTYGGGVRIEGVFTMNGGVISGNTAWDGGGVYVTSSDTFTMNGGVISDNAATTGGGVYIHSGTFTMNGGEISGNTVSTTSFVSSDGGGVYILSGTFTMNGGKISGNAASSTGSNGGGVYIYNGIFTMSGGEISGNAASSASSNGGGVSVSSIGTFTKSPGGIIYGSNASATLKNTASSDSRGHAVYVSAMYVSNAKKRNTTAGVAVTLDSSTAEGWE
jgi:fibronectin type 3 domain-containing protein